MLFPLLNDPHFIYIYNSIKKIKSIDIYILENIGQILIKEKDSNYPFLFSGVCFNKIKASELSNISKDSSKLFFITDKANLRKYTKDHIAFLQFLNTELLMDKIVLNCYSEISISPPKTINRNITLGKIQLPKKSLANISSVLEFILYSDDKYV